MSQSRKVEMSHLGYRALRLFGGIEHGGVAYEYRGAFAGRDVDACGFRSHDRHPGRKADERQPPPRPSVASE